MKGERIAAEFLALIGMVVYGVILQHIYMEVLNKPEKSWVNQARTWWVTRGSRKAEKRLRIFTLEESSQEPSVE